MRPSPFGPSDSTDRMDQSDARRTRSGQKEQKKPAAHAELYAQHPTAVWALGRCRQPAWPADKDGVDCDNTPGPDRRRFEASGEHTHRESNFPHLELSHFAPRCHHCLGMLRRTENRRTPHRPRTGRLVREAVAHLSASAHAAAAGSRPMRGENSSPRWSTGPAEPQLFPCSSHIPRQRYLTSVYDAQFNSAVARARVKWQARAQPRDTSLPSPDSRHNSTPDGTPYLVPVWRVSQPQVEQERVRNADTGDVDSTESAVWLNKVLNSIWPTAIAPAICAKILTSLNPLLANARPGIIRKLSLTRCTLGAAAPVLTACRAFCHRGDAREIEVEATVLYVTGKDMEVVLEAELASAVRLPGAGPLRVPVYAKELSISGTVRVRLSGEETREKQNTLSTQRRLVRTSLVRSLCPRLLFISAGRVAFAALLRFVRCKRRQLQRPLRGTLPAALQSVSCAPRCASPCVFLSPRRRKSSRLCRG